MSMAEQKTKPTAASVDDFIAAVDDEARRQDCRRLVALMRRATGEEPVLWGSSIIGFGTYHYRYASGHEGDACLTGFSPRKRELSVYLTSGFDRHAQLMERLGRYRTGKSCLYLKRLSDVDLDVLEALVRASVATITAQSPASSAPPDPGR